MEQTFSDPWDNTKHVGWGVARRETYLWGLGRQKLIRSNNDGIFSKCYERNKHLYLRS